MLLVGELINASRPAVAEMIRSRDQENIERLAQSQAVNCVEYIDLNAGVFIGEEKEHLQWLVKTTQAKTQLPCCIDSPDPEAVEAAVQAHAGVPMINSISLEKKRFESLLSLVAGTDWKIIALCASDEGMPKTVDQRLTIAEKLINGLAKKGVSIRNIFIDALAQPLATDTEQTTFFLKTIAELQSTFDGVNTICGLSNISYGLPQRSLVNRTFASMAIAFGLSAAIINPLDRELMAEITAAEALAGADPYCMKYLSAFRENRLTPANGKKKEVIGESSRQQ